MQYTKMAKHFQFEYGANGNPDMEDAEWLTGGRQKIFTEGQHTKLVDALEKERERWHDRLIRQGVLLDGVPLPPLKR